MTRANPVTRHVSVTDESIRRSDMVSGWRKQSPARLPESLFEVSHIG